VDNSTQDVVGVFIFLGVGPPVIKPPLCDIYITPQYVA